jgi:S-DNA-T family DNA segregation ATPase FtsK/SpoIIIE
MATKKKKKTEIEKNPYRDEIILVVSLVVSCLLALSTFNLAGVFGRWVSSLLFGLFGVLAYLLPYLLFFGIAFGISNPGNRTAKIKLASGAGLFLVLTALIQLIFGGYHKEQKLLEIYKLCAEGKKNGGLLGGTIMKGLCYVFGRAGTYVVLLGLGAILVMLLTERLLFAGIKNRRERLVKERQKRQEERQERKTVSYAEEMPRRKAKVFTFEKETKKEMPDKAPSEPEIKLQPEPVIEPEPGLQPVTELEPVIEAKTEPMMEPTKESEKKSLFNFKRVHVPDSFFAPDKEEIPEENIEEKEELPVYEEELKNKFHSSIEVDKLGDLEIFRAQTFLTESSSEFSNENSVSEELEGSKTFLTERSSEFSDENSVSVESSSDNIPIEPAFKRQTRDGEAVTEEIQSAENQDVSEKKPPYVFPPLSLLSNPQGNVKGVSDEELKETAAKLKATLESFGVKVEMKNVSCGPSVTRYELQPAMGVKVSKITSLADDIKLSLAAADIRIEAPIPGKSAVGIEVPNKENATVMLRTLLESKEFQTHPSNIAFAVGKDIGGNTIVTDIGKMPHLLIAGATGSGKSVCINTLIMSILYKANPEDVKLIMVDPKVVELSVYNGIPHLMIPVVTDPKKASGALNWAVMEMTERYKKFADLGVRDMKGYNEKVAVVAEDNDERFQKLPQIVIIVDELADLMMVAPGEVEDAICRLAQMARAAGIHLIIATQRPSVNVITGLIKANVPSRIAFSVSSAIDSRTILDGGGAEKLLGKGDMLFFPSGYPKPVRIQGAFVSDKEVSDVVEFLSKENGAVTYNEEVTNQITAVQTVAEAGGSTERDDYFVEAGKFIIEKDKASIGMLQRVYKIGFNRAARIMDQLCDAGVVGPEEGTKPRKVLMSLEEFEQYVDEWV